jgi:O-antigen/teichoic acid export membrane protein
VTKRALLKGAGLIALAELVSRIISFISFAILVIWLSPENYGVFAIAWMFFVLADSLFDFGASINYFEAEKYNKQALGLYRGIVSLIGSFWFLLMLLISAGLWLLEKTDEGEVLFVLALSLIPRIFFHPYISAWAYHQQYNYLLTNKILAAGVGGLVSVGFAYSGFEEISLALRFLATSIFSALLVLFVAKRTHHLMYDFILFRQWIKKGAKFTATTNWGWMVFFYIEQQAVLHIFGQTSLGLYNYAKKFIEVGMQVIASISRTVVLPYFVRKHANSMKVLLSTAILVGLGMLGALVFVLIAPSISSFVTDRWSMTVIICAYMSLSIPVAFGNSVLSMYLISKDQYKNIVFSEFLSILILFVLGYSVYILNLELKHFAFFVSISLLVKFLSLSKTMQTLKIIK